MIFKDLPVGRFFIFSRNKLTEKTPQKRLKISSFTYKNIVQNRVYNTSFYDFSYDEVKEIPRIVIRI